MRVRVIVMPAAEVQLQWWVAQLGATRDDRVAIGAAYMTAFRQSVEAAQGPPPDARADRRTDPPTYWAELTGGVWLRFAVRDEWGVRRGVTRRVEVLEVGRPPTSTAR